MKTLDHIIIQRDDILDATPVSKHHARHRQWISIKKNSGCADCPAERRLEFAPPSSGATLRHASNDGRFGSPQGEREITIASARLAEFAPLDQMRSLLQGLAIPVTLVLGTTVVYWTGGTGYAYPYVMFIPILLAAGQAGISGAIAVAVVAGLLLGPYMPLDVAKGIDQSTANWLTRLAFFSGIGGFAGILFQRLRQIAHIDQRNGLPNQLALRERLRSATTHAYFRHSQVGIALVRATDIDEVLDAIGTDAGDELMASLAHQLGENLGLQEIYRYSASSLAAVFENTDSATMRSKAMTIGELSEASLNVRGIPVRLELCTGVALSEGARLNADELIRRCRIAVATAQRRERDFAFYTEGDERQNTDTLNLVAHLRDALDNDEFEVHYQPKVTLSPDGPEHDRVESVEGLIRWHPPGHDRIPPGRFIGKVERTRLIVPLTRFVVEAGSRFATDQGDLRVALNLAPRSLYDETLIADLETAVRDGSVDATRLEFEVTESALMTDPETSIRNLERLRNLGARVSIDDFGTGYSSFEYLLRFPVTGLKIDKTFVDNLTPGSRTENMVRCMVQLGHALDLEVTAEGVESNEALESLRAMDCDMAQGFVHTPALPPAELVQWMQDNALRSR